MNPAATWLFEAAWEVANKVGGIHTVITSKLPLVQAEYGEHYMAIGPDLGQGSRVFSDLSLPKSLESVASMLTTEGITFRYGEWNVPGQPRAILLNWQQCHYRNNEWKAQYWEQFQLDSLGSDFYDVDTPLMWSTVVGIFTRAFAHVSHQNITLQVHEWMAGGAILALAKNQPSEVRTVFTTHATVLGRALSSRGSMSYDQLSSINPEVSARSCNVTTKHQIERLAAGNANLFTTVSGLTAEEATQFLGRTPEVITENGLSEAQLPDLQQLALKRQVARTLLEDFTAAYFFPSDQFNLDQTYFTFTMGRYEVVNKGYDQYIGALGELNTKLKAEKSEKTVIGLVLVPASNAPLRPDAAQHLALYRQVRIEMARLENDVLTSAYRQHWNVLDITELPVPRSSKIQSLIDQVSAQESAEICPFSLGSNEGRSILDLAARSGLENKAEDRVKLVFFPIYLDGQDGVFNLPLYDVIAGCDLGIFPSRYEPWGYTPLECLAMGVPAITSDLAGFGLAVQSLPTDPTHGLGGIDVLNRRLPGPNESTMDIVTHIMKSLVASRHATSQARIGAYLGAQTFTWERLYARYQEAYVRIWNT